jgi:hypothetical protein
LSLAAYLWKPLEAPPVTNVTEVIRIPIASPNDQILEASNMSKQQNFTSASNANKSALLANHTSQYNVTHSGTTVKNVSSRIEGDTKIQTTTIHSVGTSAEHEVNLFTISLLFGTIGASVHALGSVTMWYSKGKLERSYSIWYVTRPPIGAALAVAVYMLLRASLLNSFVSGGTELSGQSLINDYGVAGLSVIVGLMTPQMTQKLRDVFDAFFGIAKGTDKGEVEEIPSKNIKLIPSPVQMRIDEDSALIAMVRDNHGSPISKVGVDFGITDAKIIVPLEESHKETDNNGIALFRIKGKSEGKTMVVSKVKIGEETAYADSEVIVLKPTSEPSKTPEPSGK